MRGYRSARTARRRSSARRRDSSAAPGALRAWAARARRRTRRRSRPAPPARRRSCAPSRARSRCRRRSPPWSARAPPWRAAPKGWRRDGRPISRPRRRAAPPGHSRWNPPPARTRHAARAAPRSPACRWRSRRAPVTSCPSRRSASARCPPMKPAAPVTQIFATSARPFGDTMRPSGGDHLPGIDARSAGPTEIEVPHACRPSGVSSFLQSHELVSSRCWQNCSSCFRTLKTPSTSRARCWQFACDTWSG